MSRRALICLCAIAGLLVAGYAARAATYQDYAYEKPHQDYDWGSVGVTLTGTERMLGDGTASRGSPYDLTVWFSFLADSVAPHCIAHVEQAQLTSATTAAYTSDPKDAPFKPDKLAGSGVYAAAVTYKSIDLGYQDYIVNLKFSVEGCPDGQTPPIADEIRLSMNTHYEEATTEPPPNVPSSLLDILRGY